VTVLLETPTLDVVVTGGMAELTFRRPEQLNPFDDAMHVDFLQALRTLTDREDLRVLVLASTGRAFSAGGDMGFLRDAHGDRGLQIRSIEDGRKLLNLVLDFPVPIVTAVQGPAMGLAANLAGASDVVVSARGVTFADPHVRVGLVAGDGGCVVWPQAVGMLRARRHLLTGDPLLAEDAWMFGLVTDLVDTAGEVLPAAREIATRIAALPPLAVRGTKQALNRVLQQRAGEVFELGLLLEARTIGTDDLLEATNAFLDRRPGVYRGS
jgi:enoyl-CoA hydratase